MLPKKSMNSPVDSCVKKYVLCQPNMAVYGETRLQSISCWSDPQVLLQNDFGLWMILIHGEVVDGDFPTKICGVHMSLIVTPK